MTEEKTLESVIKALNPKDDAHWTKGGKPDLNVLKERLGRDVIAAERDTVAWMREDALKALEGNTEEKAEDDGNTKTDGETPTDEAEKPEDAANSANTSGRSETPASPSPVSRGVTETAPTVESVLAACQGDALLLCEALTLAVAGDRFKRNSPLQQIAQHYRAEQRGIKDHQARIDARKAGQ